MNDAVPGQPHVDGALDILLTQGVLGALCVLLGAALFVAIRGWLKEKDARIADRKEMSDTMSGVNDALRDLVIESNKGASNLHVDAARTADAVKNTLHNQEKAFDELRGAVSSLQQEQVRLGLVVQTSGKR